MRKTLAVGALSVGCLLFWGVLSWTSGGEASPATPAAVGDGVGDDASAVAADMPAVVRGAAGSPAELPAAHRRAITTGRITGRVVDDAARPVAGARVLFEPSRNALRKNLLRSVGGSSSRFDNLAQTRSGADGGFTLPAAARGQVIALAKGYVGTRRSSPATAGSAFELGDVVLTPAGLLSGTVLDPEGRPLAGAVVTFEARERPVVALANDEMVRTGVDGRFLIAVVGSADGAGKPQGEQLPGFLVAQHPSFRAQRLPCARPALGTETTGLVIQCQAGVTMRGVVVGAKAVEDLLPGSLKVLAWPEERSAAFQRSERRVGIGSDGRFEIDGLVEGQRYRLRLAMDPSRLDLGARAGPIVTADADAQDVQLEVVAPCRVRFHLAAGGGDGGMESGVAGRPPGVSVPLAHVRALIALESKGRRVHALGEGRLLSPKPKLIQADREGVFEMAVFPSDAQMKLGLGVVAEGCAPAYRFDVDIPQDGVIPRDRVVELGEIRLRRLPILRVVVCDRQSGRPLPGARVALRPLDDRMASTSMSVTGWSAEQTVREAFATGNSLGQGVAGPKGVARVGLQSPTASKCTAWVTHRGYAKARLSPVLLPSKGGEPTLRVDLDPGATIEVCVVNEDGAPVGGAQVSCRSAASWKSRQRIETDALGCARIDHLPAGTYSISAAPQREGADASWMMPTRTRTEAAASVEFEVPESGVHTVRVELRRP